MSETFKTYTQAPLFAWHVVCVCSTKCIYIMICAVIYLVCGLLIKDYNENIKKMQHCKITNRMMMIQMLENVSERAYEYHQSYTLPRFFSSYCSNIIFIFCWIDCVLHKDILSGQRIFLCVCVSGETLYYKMSACYIYCHIYAKCIPFGWSSLIVAARLYSY